jgi:hypothetical protein
MDNSCIAFATDGTPFIIDNEDADSVLTRNWYSSKRKGGVYLMSNVPGSWRPGASALKREYIHHFVFKFPGQGNIIDHINGDRQDNRKENLQEISRGKNLVKGRDRGNIAGARGVYPHRDGRFMARITFKGKGYYLGLFKTVSEASIAFKSARLKLHGYVEGADNV